MNDLNNFEYNFEDREIRVLLRPFRQNDRMGPPVTSPCSV